MSDDGLGDDHRREPIVEPGRSDPETLVWLDRREAIVVRWDEGAVVERVCAGRRATGNEALAGYLHQVADHVPPDHDVRIVGPRAVRRRLGRLLRTGDGTAEHHVCPDRGDSGSERRLLVRVRALLGRRPLPPRRDR